MKKKVPNYIRDFCTTISDQEPIIIPLRPLTGKPLNDCFAIVPEYISVRGGKQRYGWCIHVWKDVLVEADFHCVWESPEDMLVDLTPKVEKGDAIIFLPDTTITYNGVQIENKRKLLTSDINVKTFIGLQEEKFRRLNQGDLATKYGKLGIDDLGVEFIDLEHRMLAVYSKIVKRFGDHRTLAT